MDVRTGELVEAAYRANHAILVRHLTTITRDAEAAQDLAHEAFIRLAAVIDDGRMPDDAAAWLHRVGANLATSRGRHLQVVDRHARELPLPADAPDPEHAVVRDELAGAVVAVMAELPEHERKALVLAAHGVGGGEIASAVGRTVGATRTMLCRARGRIRARLALAGYAAG